MASLNKKKAGRLNVDSATVQRFKRIATTLNYKDRQAFLVYISTEIEKQIQKGKYNVELDLTPLDIPE